MGESLDQCLQPELFDWNAPDAFLGMKPKKKKTRKAVDYEALYELFKKGPVHWHDIEVASGVSHSTVAQVITTLSLRYPIYELKRGVYKLYGDEEYGDGIKKSLLNEEN